MSVNRRKSYKTEESYQTGERKWKSEWRKRTGSFRYDPRQWTLAEDQLVLAHEMPDRELSKLIHRSAQAIQVRRSRLKSGSVYSIR